MNTENENSVESSEGVVDDAVTIVAEVEASKSVVKKKVAKVVATSSADADGSVTSDKPKVVKSKKSVVVKKKEPKPGEHLLPAIHELVSKSGLMVKPGAFDKVSGKAKKKFVYVAAKSPRVDLSGFTFDHPAVVKITAEEAKEKHIGKVRGQLDFTKSDDVVLDALRVALVELDVEDPVKEKKEA